MANWLTKASGALSREAPEVPQPFRLTCECGSTHQGQRKSRPQRIICQTCGTALFVLPRNVYPELKPRTSKRKRKKRDRSNPDRSASVGERSRRAGAGAQRFVQAVGGGVRGATNSVVSRIVGSITGVLQWIRSQITPFRVVIAGVVTLLIATGVWTSRSRGLEQARETLRLELTAGEDALKADDLVQAKEHFTLAAAAADHLQLDDVRAQLARQMSHETIALTRLAPASLIEMLEEGETITAAQSPAAWTGHFQAKYAGTWMVIQAPVRLAEPSERPAALIVDMPVLIGESGRAVSLTITDSAMSELGLTSEAQVIWFAATLEDCVLNTGADRWEVILDGKTCFLWADVDNLRRLGFFSTDGLVEEETAEQLAEQSQRLGPEK